MKIYKTSVYPSSHELYELLMETVNPEFADKIKTDDLPLTVTEKAGGIEIGQPGRYQTYLYKINVVGHEVHVSKSEHYTDDVINLALEDIISSIIHQYIGDDNIETIQ